MKSHDIQHLEKYDLIKLGAHLGAAGYKLFEADAEVLMRDCNKQVFIDCKELVSISHDWIRLLLKLQVSLKRKQLSLKLVNVSLPVVNFLKREGINTAFSISATFEEALQNNSADKKKKFDIAFINPFLEATIKVLKVQASIESSAQKIVLKKDDQNFRGDISGIIGIVSDNFNGTIVISFPESTFLKIMGGMLGEEFHEINKDIIDGAGEITNMIFGQAKILLNEKGYGIKTALPSVVHGKDHSTTSQTKGPVVIIPFESGAGNFHVEICLSV
jgi:chemotaxis protein CheX